MAKILVCDDDKDIVEAIDIYLTQEGYQCPGRPMMAFEALEISEEGRSVDLLIIDIMMPRAGRYPAQPSVFARSSSIPIIILSAKTEDADKILGLNIGADDYVTKPFSPLELVARVKSQLAPLHAAWNHGREHGECGSARGGLVVDDDKKAGDCGWREHVA